MGQAKLRKKSDEKMIYHHTSSIRTNEIWMSGVIAREGEGAHGEHPVLGTITTDPLLRRAMKDFPALVWFTRNIEIPRCLIGGVQAVKKTEDGTESISLSDDLVNAMALRRIALGFAESEIAGTPWPEHFGYSTPEGAKLNQDARDVGDNPDDWWVADAPVDVLKAKEVWVSPSILKPKLTKHDGYLADVKRMVTLCRTTPGTYIPPSWTTPESANLLAAALGVKVSIGGC